MRYRTSVEVDAPAERVWAVLIDVERWPEWTASMRRVHRLDSGEWAVGCRAEVRQPRLPAAVWRVTDVRTGRSFTWENRSAGLRSTAVHRIDDRPGGGVTVTLEFAQVGALARLAELLAGRLARRYVDTEAAGLKSRCERTGSG